MITNKNFGEALVALKKGFKIARAGWNGKGMFAYLVEANQYPANTRIAKNYWGEKPVPYKAYLALKTVDEDIATWTPSGSDILADDWIIMNPFSEKDTEESDVGSTGNNPYESMLQKILSGELSLDEKSLSERFGKILSSKVPLDEKSLNDALSEDECSGCPGCEEGIPLSGFLKKIHDEMISELSDDDKKDLLRSMAEDIYGDKIESLKINIK